MKKNKVLQLAFFVFVFLSFAVLFIARNKTFFTQESDYQNY